MITVKAALDVAKTMFCSIVDYGNIFLTACTKSELKDIQTLQYHASLCLLKCFTLTFVYLEP